MRRQVLTAELEELGLEIDASHNRIDKSGRFRTVILPVLDNEVPVVLAEHDVVTLPVKPDETPVAITNLPMEKDIPVDVIPLEILEKKVVLPVSPAIIADKDKSKKKKTQSS